jgi:hypothetical protein
MDRIKKMKDMGLQEVKLILFIGYMQCFHRVIFRNMLSPRSRAMDGTLTKQSVMFSSRVSLLNVLRVPQFSCCLLKLIVVYLSSHTLSCD